MDRLVTIERTEVKTTWLRQKAGHQLPCGCIGPDIFSSESKQSSFCSYCQRSWKWLSNSSGGMCEMIDGKRQGLPVLILDKKHIFKK
jgi:hypothetical protein